MAGAGREGDETRKQGLGGNGHEAATRASTPRRSHASREKKYISRSRGGKSNACPHVLASSRAVSRCSHPSPQRSLQPHRAGHLRLLQQHLRFLWDVPRQALRRAPVRRGGRRRHRPAGQRPPARAARVPRRRRCPGAQPAEAARHPRPSPPCAPQPGARGQLRQRQEPARQERPGAHRSARGGARAAVLGPRVGRRPDTGRHPQGNDRRRADRRLPPGLRRAPRALGHRYPRPGRYRPLADPRTGDRRGALCQDKAKMLAALDKVLQAPEAVQLRPESWRLL